MTRRTTRSELGKAGENAAARYLESLGYKIVAHNLRTKHGEIDLLLRRRSLWIAAEVKTRRYHPAPERCVETEQLERLARALQKLSPTLKPRPKELRVDVVAVRVFTDDSQVLHFPGRSWVAPN